MCRYQSLCVLISWSVFGFMFFFLVLPRKERPESCLGSIVSQGSAAGESEVEQLRNRCAGVGAVPGLGYLPAVSVSQPSLGPALGAALGSASLQWDRTAPRGSVLRSGLEQLAGSLHLHLKVKIKPVYGWCVSNAMWLYYSWLSLL